jgi:hypothetical protein
MKLLAAIPILITALCLAGCGSGPRTVPVRGVVKYKGEPLSLGFLTFSPEDPSSCRPGSAVLAEDGTFKATTVNAQEGLMIGKYKVSVDTTSLKGEQSKLAKKRSGIPAKYSDIGTSGLTIQVDGDAGAKEFVLDLVD